MILKRKIYSKLLNWKNKSNGSSALLIEGARRIGKSFIVEEFAKNEYDSYMLIDFSNANALVKSWFDDYLDDLDSLLNNLQLYYKKRLRPRKSLIIFDEIQNCPRARQAIKPLVADGRFDYIETGSLISIKKNVKDIQIPSEEDSLEMFPMDFEEFLWALGEDMLMPYIERQFKQRQPMGGFHRRAMEYFRQYLIVGGMPQAVLEYSKTKDFERVDDIKRRILKLYRDDINKYADNLEVKVSSIFDEIPSQLQKHEKKFKLSSLGQDARMRDYADSFFWLADAKIINCCYNTTEPSIGLRLCEDRTSVKCYFGDTGLLVSHAFDAQTISVDSLYTKLLFDKLEFNEGMLIENIVAQMLRSAGHKLFFFSKSDNSDAMSRMEIDFLIPKQTITTRHNIIPLEVKSGKKYTLTSLTKCCQKYKEQITQPTVLHTADLQEIDGVLYLPLYMTPLL